MDFAEVVRRRKMVRSFTNDPVPPDVVHRILDTARRGPSAGHSQAVEFVLITDPDLRAAIAKPGKEMFEELQRPDFVSQAPVHVVICVSPEIYKSRYRESDKQQVVSDVDEDALWKTPFWYTDAGAAMTLLLLAAVNEGISAAFVGGLEDDYLRKLLSIPDDYLPIGIALLGHEAPDAKDWGDVSARKRPRRPYDEIVHTNQW